jgi:hypothetical protein
MKQGLEVEPTPVEGVGENEESRRAVHIKYPIEYKSLLDIIARGIRNLVVYNRGNTTYMKPSKILRAAFFERGFPRVYALPIVFSQVRFVLERLKEEGLVDKADGYYTLSNASQLWSIARNSTPEEIANFLWELTMEG